MRHSVTMSGDDVVVMGYSHQNVRAAILQYLVVLALKTTGEGFIVIGISVFKFLTQKL